MSFAFPLGLLGLLSLPVIIVLHLLRERYKRVSVSHLPLWDFLEHEVHGPRTKRLPLTLLLVMDLLAATLLTLALSQPRLHLPAAWQSARHRVIVIDTSTSMRGAAGESLAGSRFQAAQASALELLERSGRRDVVTVVAFGRTAHWVGDSRQDGLDVLRQRLSELPVGETGNALSEALALGKAALDPRLPAEFYILTDGAFPADTSMLESFPHPLTWQLVGGEAGNQAVLALNAVSLGQNRYQVFARFANYSPRSAERTAELALNGAQVERARLELPPESTVVQVWEIEAPATPGAAVSVALQGGDALAQDDQAFLGLQAGGPLQVVLVTDNPAPLEQALTAVPEVQVTQMSLEQWQAQAGAAQGGQNAPALTVFRGVIPQQWPQGLALLVEPPTTPGIGGESTPPGLYGGELVRTGSRSLAANAPLLAPLPSPITAGVDFGGVRWERAYELAEPPAGFATLLQAGDTPLLLRGAPESGGQLIVLLADLERGNFTRHPAFPILMANIVQAARQAPLPASLASGEPAPLPAPGEYTRLRLNSPAAPALDLSEWPPAWEATHEPGIYRFRFERPDGQTLEHALGVNAGDALESNLRPRAWTSSLPQGGEADASEPGGDRNAPERRPPPFELMPWLLALAVLVFILEASLAWR